MRVVLTGGIATGKSVVGQALAAAGLPVVDADELARDAVAPGSSGLRAVVERFGAGVLQPEGTLHRAALARLVFADATARRDLERIVHPRVRTAIDAFFASTPAGLPAVAEVPLAYETGWVTAFACVVVVACRPETQRQRLVARDGLSLVDVQRRLDAQWPIADKVRLADAVVMTEGDHASTLTQAARLAAWLRARSRPS